MTREEMTREEMWEEFESQLISEVRTPITMSYDDSIRIAEIGIKEVVERWKKRLEQEPKTGHCKDCKFFEYDSVAKVDGIPLIVAHEICSRWGDGCKTKEDGYCFLFEPQEGSE